MALAAAAAAGKRLLLSSPSSSLSFAPRRFAAAGPLRAGLLLRAPRRAVSASASSVAVGDRLPDAILCHIDSPDYEVKTVTVRDLTAGKKVVLFAVMGAFVPICTHLHLPGFVAKAGELRAKGVDTVACVSVNDPYVMRAWKESLGVGDEVLLLSDGWGELTRALGVELARCFGVRSRRYALLAEDGVVKVLNLDGECGEFTNSSAEELLKAL